MGESKHTPGPWVVSHSSDKRTGTRIRTALPMLEGARDGMSVARIDYAAGLTEGRANAALIAAAPLMLEALREVTEALGHWQNAPPVAQDWFARARAAIEAATGGET